MWFKLVLVLLLALVKNIILEETENSADSVASTSQHSPQNQIFNERLTELEDRLEFQTKISERSSRLEALERQNKQMQMMLHNINCVLTNFTHVQSEIAASRHKLEAVERRSEQIQTRLQNINSELANITGMSRSKELVETIPRDCKEAKARGKYRSQVYRIKPELATKPFFVFCDMETRGGGWAYVLNRFDGSQNFDLNWIDYRNGFGNPAGESWLGLEHLYQLTNSVENELLFELVIDDGKKVYSLYKTFSIGNESEGYPLKIVSERSGDAGESFIQHHGMKFSTKDKDQDTSASNCAMNKSGGWWYEDCSWSKLTGRYLKGKLAETDRAQGIHWGQFSGFDNSLKEAKMMIRPKN